jgi:hypothetical protein
MTAVTQDPTRDGAAIARVRAMLRDAASRLTEAEARSEALAEYVPASRTLIVGRPERMRRLGSVWRLGVLLLTADAAVGRSVRRAPTDGPEVPALYATGSITRAHEPGRMTHIAVSAERRRQLRVAAYRGRFSTGETVNYNATPIELDESLIGASGPLTVRDGAAYVRWAPSDPGSLIPFEAYLAERVSLLVTPPEGA